MAYQIAWRRDGNEHTQLTATSVDGREVVVAATADHGIGIWDAAGGTPAGRGHTGHSHVFGLAATVMDGRPVVASLGLNTVPWDIVEEYFGGDEDASEVGVISLWDPATGEELGSPITDDGAMGAAGVLGLTATTDGEPPLLLGIIGNEIGSGCVVTWNLKTRVQELCLPHDAFDRGSYLDAMAPVPVDGRQAVVAAGSRVHFDEESGGTYQLQASDIRTGDPIGRPWEITASEREIVLAATIVSGQPVAAVWAPADDHIRLHRLPDGQPVGALPIADVGSPALLRTGNDPNGAAILAAAHADGTVTAWDLAEQDRIATVTDLAPVNDLLLTANGDLIIATEDGLTAIRL